MARSEAHDSGLCAVEAATRRRFAADLLNLTLASPSVNRHQKTDNDGAEWLPDLNQCWFVDRVVRVRQEYGLTIDQREVDALEAVLSSCSSFEMVVVPAPVQASPTAASTPTPSSSSNVDALGLQQLAHQLLRVSRIRDLGQLREDHESGSSSATPGWAATPAARASSAAGSRSGLGRWLSGLWRVGRLCHRSGLVERFQRRRAGFDALRRYMPADKVFQVSRIPDLGNLVDRHGILVDDSWLGLDGRHQGLQVLGEDVRVDPGQILRKVGSARFHMLSASIRTQRHRCPGRPCIRMPDALCGRARFRGPVPRRR